MVCLLKPSGVRNCDSRLPPLQQIAFAFTNGESVRVYYCYKMALNNNWFHNLQTDSTVLLIVKTSFESQYHIILLYLIYECGHINLLNCKFAKFYFFYSSVFQILLIVIFLPALFPLVCKFSSVNVSSHLYVNVCNLFINYWDLILILPCAYSIPYGPT